MIEFSSYWQVYTVLAIIFSVAFNQFYRLTAKKSRDTSSMFIIIFIIMSIIFILMIPFSKIRFPLDWYVWGMLFVSIIFYTINDRIKAASYKYLDVSIVSILTQLSKVILIFYGIIFLNEYLSFLNIVGIVLITAGGILVVFKKDIFKINKYVWLMIVAAFAFSSAIFIDVGISVHFNLMMYLLIVFLTPAIIVFLLERKKINDLRVEFNNDNKQKKYYVLTGIFFALASIFYLLALRKGQISIVAPLTATVPLFNVVVGYIVLKEREDLVKRLIAALLVIVGVFLLV